MNRLNKFFDKAHTAVNTFPNKYLDKNLKKQ